MSKWGDFIKLLYRPCVCIVDTAARPPQFCRSGSDVVVGGPLVGHIDGAFQEVGFLSPPEILAVTAVDSGGYLTDGASEWQLVYEWFDGHGQLHRSAAAEGVEATMDFTGATGYVTIVATPSICSARLDGSTTDLRKCGRTRLVAYRTAADAATGAVHRRSYTYGNGTVNDGDNWEVYWKDYRCGYNN